MPDYPTIPQYPEQGIQAELDLVYLWNPNAASELLAELNRMIAEVREMIDEIDLTPYRTAADQDIIDQDLQEQINTKQAVIEDLETIRSGAAAGATAVQPGDLATVATTGQYSDLIGNPTLGTAAAADVSDFATAAQGLLADTAVQPADIADMETQTHASNTYATQTTVSGIAEEVEDIQELIPTQATSSNQLADKEFVNSSIATNTANFIGTFRSVSDLRAYSGTVTNNDYAFVTNDVITDNGNDWASFADLNAYDKTLLTMFDYAWVVNGTKFDLYRFEAISQIWVQRATAIDKSSVTLNPVFNRYKATVSSGTTTWEYEYTLNNSSFTADQWTSINSGSTAESVALANSSLQPGDNVSELVNDAGYLTAHQSLTDLGITATASELNVLDGITADTTELNYVDGVTSSIQTQLDSKQATLVNQSNIKSINGNSLLGSGNLELTVLLSYPTGWTTTGTTKAFCDDVAADSTAVAGKAYLGEVTFSDLPGNMANAEVIVKVMYGSTSSTKVIVLTCTSGNVSPYQWQYTYWNGGTNVSGWIGFQPELVSGTNIKTINNNSLLGSGDITINSLPSQTGHSGEFLTTDGTDASWAAVDALPAQSGHSGDYLTTNGSSASWTTLNALQNTATGTKSLTILGTANTRDNSVNIGESSQAQGNNSVVVGQNSKAALKTVTVGCESGGASGGQEAVNIGCTCGNTASKGAISIGFGNSVSYSNYATAIGHMASVVNAVGAIQLGSGCNDSYVRNRDANTFKVANANGNFEIMSADGTVPTDRFTTTPSSDGTYVPTLTISSGTATRTWTAPASGLPSQSGQSGKFLTTDGTDASWATVDALPSQTGHSGEFLTTDGTDASWATINALQNTATRYDSLTINGNATSTQRSINIGYGSTAQAPNTTSSYKGAISIGYNCYANCNGIVIGESASNSSMFGGVVVGHGASAGSSGYYATAMGDGATVTGSGGIAIGNGAVSAADGAIQIAWGGSSGNTEAYTFKIGLNGVNYKLLDSNGTIPEARLADTTNAQQGDVLTLDANGNAVWQAGGAPTVPSTMPTLAVNDWVNNAQTVNVTGVTASNVVFVSPAPASAADYAAAGITCTAQGSGTLTFTCTTVPSNAITVNIVIFG